MVHEHGSQAAISVDVGEILSAILSVASLPQAEVGVEAQLVQLRSALEVAEGTIAELKQQLAESGSAANAQVMAVCSSIAWLFVSGPTMADIYPALYLNI